MTSMDTKDDMDTDSLAPTTRAESGGSGSGGGFKAPKPPSCVNALRQKKAAKTEQKRLQEGIAKDQETKAQAVRKQVTEPGTIAVAAKTYEKVASGSGSPAPSPLMQQATAPASMKKPKAPIIFERRNKLQKTLTESEYKRDYMAELPPSDPKITLSDTEKHNRWAEWYFRHYAEQQRIDKNPDLFYAARRAQERLWLLEDRVFINKFMVGMNTVMCMAVNTKWVVALDTGRIICAEIRDARETPVFRPTALEVPGQECNLALYKDELFVSDILGGLIIYTLPKALPTSTTIIRAPDESQKDVKKFKVAASMALNELYAIALFPENGLYVYYRKERKLKKVLNYANAKHQPMLRANSACLYGHRVHIGGADGHIYTCNLKSSSEFEDMHGAILTPLPKEATVRTHADSDEDEDDDDEGDAEMEVKQEKKDKKDEKKKFPIMQVYSQGCRVFAATEDRVRVWDYTQDPAQINDIPVSHVQGMSASGSILAMHLRNNAVVLYDLVAKQSAFYAVALNEPAYLACYDNIYLSTTPPRLAYFAPDGKINLAEIRNFDELKKFKEEKAEAEAKQRQLEEQLARTHLHESDDGDKEMDSKEGKDEKKRTAPASAVSASTSAAPAKTKTSLDIPPLVPPSAVPPTGACVTLPPLAPHPAPTSEYASCSLDMPTDNDEDL